MKTRLMKVQPQEQEIKETRDTDEAELRRMIAEAAYYRAEKRGFASGREADDWLEAEAEILSKRL